MTNPLLLTAQRTMQMIGRLDALERVKQALYQADTQGTTVLAVHGPGGIGKSRFAEEVLLQSGNSTQRERSQQGWIVPVSTPLWVEGHPGAVLAPDALDMNELRFHGSLEFMRSVTDFILREATETWTASETPVAFNAFNDAYNDVRAAHQRGLNYEAQREKINVAENAFFRAYATAAREQRILLVIDTFEKLAYYHTDWLFAWSPITKEDMLFSTTYWLEKHIAQGDFPNTLLLLLGRAADDSKLGQAFLERMERACGEQGSAVWLSPIRLPNFSLEESTLYFTRLHEDLSKASSEDGITTRLRKGVEDLLQDPRQLETLTIYTEGLPVRLALYGALVAEGLEVPKRLKDTPEQAHSHSAAELDQIQKEIGESFIELLFSSVGLRAAFLSLLVAAQRGLDWEQLYLGVNGIRYDLDEDARLSRQKENGELEENRAFYARAEIEEEVEKLKRLSIIKLRPDGRLALQDAVYEAFEKMPPERLAFIKQYKALRSGYYRYLYEYATQKWEELEAERQAYQEEEEQELLRAVRSTMFPVSLSEPPRSKLDSRIANAREIHKWEMERLHYALLLNLVEAVNDVVFELAQKNYRAQDEEADFRSLEEVYQVLYNDALLPLLELGSWPAIENDQTIDKDRSKVEVLRRFMRQAEVIRWLQRFVIRRQAQRALDLLDALERKGGYIDRLEDPRERNSWLHSFGTGERHIWWAYLQTLLGNHTEAIHELQRRIKRLKQLLAHPSSKIVPADEEAADTPQRTEPERGFADHPARRRMMRVIALAYNNLGYACVSQGQINAAIEAYTEAIKMLRVMEFQPLLPTVLTNHARALSDKGRGRARRVCLDALNMNRKRWVDVLVAYSYNTLALIENDQYHPLDARVAAAVATAYFERVKDERGLGLAYLQFGEALRRIALSSERTSAPVGQEPDRLLDEAERLLERAVKIFTEGRPKAEIVRRAEAFIEYGCLLRDRIANHPLQHMPGENVLSTYQAHYRSACHYLNLAVNLAHGKWHRLELDAQVNLSWTHFQMWLLLRSLTKLARSTAEQNHFEAEAEHCRKALEQSLDEALRSIPNPENVLIDANRPLPAPESGEPYLFQQLSKIEGLRALIAMETFNWLVEQERESEKYKEIRPRRRADEDSDFFEKHDQIYREILAKPEIAQALRQGMEAFTRALLYADLFSTRSGSISIIYSSLYKYLSIYNPRELAYAYQFAKEASQTYRVWTVHRAEDASPDERVYVRDCNQIILSKDLPAGSYVPDLARISSLSDLPTFIAESFGAFTEDDFQFLPVESEA